MVQTGRTPKIFGSSYQPPRPAKKLPKIGNSWKAILIVAVALVVISQFGRLPIFRIKTLELVGDKNEQIAQNLSKLEGQSIFSHEITSFVDNVRLSPAVSQFDCRRGIPNSLRCQLGLRTPQIIWQSAGKLYYVDKTGILYSEKNSDQPGLVTVTDQQALPAKIGTSVTSAEILKLYDDLVAKLRAKQLAVTGLLLEESLYQISAVIDRPGLPTVQAKFLLSGNISNQVESVFAVLSQHGATVGQYVDVRVAGYIYTK